MQLLIELLGCHSPAGAILIDMSDYPGRVPARR